MIERTFPKDSFRHETDVWHTSDTITRDRTSVRLDHAHVERDIESKWLFTHDAEFGYGTRLAIGVPNNLPLWSLADVAAELSASIQAAHLMFTEFGYLGEAQVFVAAAQESAALYVERGELPFQRHGSGRHVLADAPRWRDIVPDATSEESNRSAMAWLSCTFHTRTTTLVDSVADLLNQLLRDLGFGADRAQLTRYVSLVAT